MGGGGGGLNVIKLCFILKSSRIFCFKTQRGHTVTKSATLCFETEP